MYKQTGFFMAPLSLSESLLTFFSFAIHSYFPSFRQHELLLLWIYINMKRDIYVCAFNLSFSIIKITSSPFSLSSLPLLFIHSSVNRTVIFSHSERQWAEPNACLVCIPTLYLNNGPPHYLPSLPFSYFIFSWSILFSFSSLAYFSIFFFH